MSLTTSDRLLERYLLGEVSKEEKTHVEKALQEDPKLSDRLNALRKSNQDILHQYPSTHMVKAIKEKIVQQKRTERFKQVYLYFATATPLLLIAVILFLVVIPERKINLTLENNEEQILSHGANTSERLTRAKGNTELFIYRKGKENKEETLTNMQIVHPKELLQVAYLSSGEKYGTIFSLDQQGQITYHLPNNKDLDSTSLQVGKKIYLPEAYELDETLGYEIFYLVSSQQPISSKTIKKIISGFSQTTEHLDRETIEPLKDYHLQTLYLSKTK